MPFRTQMLLTGILFLVLGGAAPAGELPSWNDGAVKQAIIEYLTDITDPEHEDFIPVAARVAVLDNDGTFWCERPDYPSSMFQRGLLTSLVRQGKADSTRQPYKGWVDYDRDALRAYGWRQAYQEMNALFAGMPVTAFRDSARAYLDRTRHSEFGVPFIELYYQPMLELASLLKSHEFQVWVVTGAEQDFVRTYIYQATGIGPERVIGSWTPAVSAVEDGRVTMVRGEVQVYNGHQAKPGNIETRIGRRPVFAAGNSNNDHAMCLYAVTGQHRGLAIWIHHDDEEREYGYDRGTERMGRLTREHPSAHEVSMQRDWKKLFKGELSRP